MNSDLLKKWMNKNGLRAEDVASKLGCSFQTVARMLKGRSPHASTLVALADLIGVPARELIKDKPAKKAG
jgi:transcriptional regulator with XRE-family HTH domain